MGSCFSFAASARKICPEDAIRMPPRARHVDCEGSILMRNSTGAPSTLRKTVPWRRGRAVTRIEIAPKTMFLVVAVAAARGSPNAHQLPINAPKCPFDQPSARRTHADGDPEGPGLRLVVSCRYDQALRRSVDAGDFVPLARERVCFARKPAPQPMSSTRARAPTLVTTRAATHGLRRRDSARSSATGSSSAEYQRSPSA